MNIYSLIRIKFKKWILIFSILSSILTFSKFVDANGLACESLFNNYNFRISLSSSWGTELISPDHPTWKDPEYMKMLFEYGLPGITNYGGKADRLLSNYTDLFEKMSSGVKPLSFTSNGTQANNLIIETLNNIKLEELSTGTKKVKSKVEFLHFENMYGGSFGKSLELNRNKETTIPSPYIPISELNDENKINQVIQIENEAITYLENKLNSKTIAVSAIYIEPIAASRAYGFGTRIVVYRQEFINRLTEIAHNYSIPIVADEILTGGGRTGNFFAFQYYNNFQPDIITFGKGIAISGVAVNSNSNNRFIRDKVTNKIKRQSYAPTTEINPLALAQSYWVLKNIDELNLIQNARENGSYLISKAKEILLKQRNQSANPSSFDKVYVDGIGMLISIRGNINRSRYVRDEGYNFRILPPISLTKFQIDSIFEIEKSIYFYQ